MPTVTTLPLLSILISVVSAVNVIPNLVGGANVMGSGTYPRANFLSDGSLIGAYTVHAGGNSTITLAQSTDNGTTWTEIGTAAQRPSATSDLDNPYPLQLASGRVLVAFRNHDKTASGAYTQYRITVCSSDDGGHGWQYLSTPAQNAASGVNGVWEPFMRNARDGSLQLYYSKENNASDQDSMMVASTNGGSTWSGPATISGGELANARDGMLGVASVSGTNLMAVFESEQAGGAFGIHSITSADDGKTWGNRQLVYAPAANRNAGAPQIAQVGGALVASFMTDEDAPSPGKWVDSPVAKLVTSSNGGATWGNKFTWSPNASYWPGLLDLGGSTFLAMADHGGAKAQHIALS